MRRLPRFNVLLAEACDSGPDAGHVARPYAVPRSLRRGAHRASVRLARDQPRGWRHGACGSWWPLWTIAERSFDSGDAIYCYDEIFRSGCRRFIGSFAPFAIIGEICDITCMWMPTNETGEGVSVSGEFTIAFYVSASKVRLAETCDAGPDAVHDVHQRRGADDANPHGSGAGAAPLPS